VALLAAFGGSEDRRLAALPFVVLEPLEEGDDRLWVAGFLCAGARCAIRLC